MNNGGGSQAGGNGNQAGQNTGGGQVATTTTSTAGQQQTPTTTAIHGATSTSTSTSSGNQKGAIIGGVVGGLCGLLIIALIGVWLLQRRKKKQIAKQNGSTEPTTYAGLNASFSGVPFGSAVNQRPHNSLVPPPLFQSHTNTSATGSGAPLRDGEASPYGRDSASEGDHFLPSYAESQSDISRRMRNSLGRIDTSGHLHDSAYVSPVSTGPFSPRSQGTPYQHTPTFTPQQTYDTMGFPRDHHHTGMDPLDLPPMPRLPAGSRDTIDTMGFPVETTQTEMPVSQGEVPIESPRPVYPTTHQNSLERVTRQDTGMSESPVLGFGDRQPPRKFGPHPGPPSTSANYGMPSGVSRNISVKTVSSMNSYAPPMVSDAELERLGVGSRHRPDSP